MQEFIIHSVYIAALVFVDQSLYDEMWYIQISVVCTVLMVAYLMYNQWKRHQRHTMQEQLLFTRQLIDSMEAERQRIAAELHDSIGQDLLIVKNRALLALNDLKDKKNLHEHLDEISNTASRTIEEIREITYNLRPYQIDKLGLTKALESIISRAERTTTISITSDIDPIDKFIPKEMEIHIYRIIQECVNNILKHAQATEGKITIKRWYNRVNIDVEDNGAGFDASKEQIKNARGIGLQGIAERTRLIGGTMRVESIPGKGTRILITIRTYDRVDDTE